MVIDVILSVVPLFKGQDDEFGIIWLAIQKPLLFLDPLEFCIDFLFGDVLYQNLSQIDEVLDKLSLTEVSVYFFLLP